MEMNQQQTSSFAVGRSLENCSETALEPPVEDNIDGSLTINQKGNESTAKKLLHRWEVALKLL